MKPSERLISQLPQEIQALFDRPPVSWKQSQNHPITESSRDETDLYGEWEHEDDNATLWVISTWESDLAGEDWISKHCVDGSWPGA